MYKRSRYLDVKKAKQQNKSPNALSHKKGGKDIRIEKHERHLLFRVS